MPVGPYLRVAADQLRRAAHESKREADETRAAIHEAEIKLKSEQNSLERRLSRQKIDVRGANEMEKKAVHQAEVEHLQQEIKQAEQQLQAIKQQHLDVITIKEQQMRELNQRADELQRRSSEV